MAAESAEEMELIFTNVVRERSLQSAIEICFLGYFGEQLLLYPDSIHLFIPKYIQFQSR